MASSCVRLSLNLAVFALLLACMLDMAAAQYGWGRGYGGWGILKK